MSARGPLVTVDGPAASGKSTAARRLALALGVPYLYTGALYRAVTWLALRRGIPLRDARRVAALARRLRFRTRLGRDGRARHFLGRLDVTGALASEEISRRTSAVTASHLEVRAAVVARSRRALTLRGLVAEGRDCGSVIFPAAPFKIFLTASVAERARRRWEELRRAGSRVALAVVRRDMARRDREDRERPVGAVRAEPDAWIVDNTGLRPEETLARMLRRVVGRAV